MEVTVNTKLFCLHFLEPDPTFTKVTMLMSLSRQSQQYYANADLTATAVNERG